VKKSEKYLKTKIKCCIGYFLLLKTMMKNAALTTCAVKKLGHDWIKSPMMSCDWLRTDHN